MFAERKMCQESTLAELLHGSGWVNVQSQQLSCQAAAQCLSLQLRGFLETLCPHSQGTHTQALLGHCVNLPVALWMLLQSPKAEGKSLPHWLSIHSCPAEGWVILPQPSHILPCSDPPPADPSLVKTPPGLTAAFRMLCETLSDKTIHLPIDKGNEFQPGALSADLLPSIQSPALCLCWKGSSGRERALSGSERCEVSGVFHISLKTHQY